MDLLHALKKKSRKVESFKLTTGGPILDINASDGEFINPNVLVDRDAIYSEPGEEARRAFNAVNSICEFSRPAMFIHDKAGRRLSLRSLIHSFTGPESFPSIL